MADIRDYIRWRGDLTFSQAPVTPADALVFCALSYIHFDNLLEDPDTPRELQQAADSFFALPNRETLIRNKYDPELLALAADSVRFGQSQLAFYRDVLDPAKDTQFAAMTFLLDDGTAMITFRGTDFSVVGWKEDFNMSYQQTVPAQRLAVEYTQLVSEKYAGLLRICGHSKGGNMAVFAAARSSPEIQSRILEIYNNDGPGFSSYMMGDPGYKAMVPKIHTFVPQSSIIGMLMDHEEPYTIIRANQIGLLQHEVYNWQVMGPGFLPMEEITADSRFFNETIRLWSESLSNEQRNQIVNAMFGLLQQGNVEEATDILSPKNVRSYLKILGSDEALRKVLGAELQGLADAAKATLAEASRQRELEAEKEKEPRRQTLLSRLAERKLQRKLEREEAEQTALQEAPGEQIP